MARLVLTDASPLIALTRVDGVDWLRSLFGTVEMTRAVRRELGRAGSLEPQLEQALDQGWLVARANDPEGPGCPPHLGDGEWTTLLAAREHDGDTLVLVDDSLARREARRLGLEVAGTAAVVGAAARHELIPSAREVFERLLQSDFRISATVIRAVLDRLDREG